MRATYDYATAISVTSGALFQENKIPDTSIHQLKKFDCLQFRTFRFELSVNHVQRKKTKYEWKMQFENKSRHSKLSEKF